MKLSSFVCCFQFPFNTFLTLFFPYPVILWIDKEQRGSLVHIGSVLDIILTFQPSLRTPRRLTRMPMTSPSLRCSPPTPFGWAWPSTSRSSFTKFSTHQRRPANWPKRCVVPHFWQFILIYFSFFLSFLRYYPSYYLTTISRHWEFSESLPRGIWYSQG